MGFLIGRMTMTDKVTLVDIRGASSRYIYAEITDKGDLLLEGYDNGEAPLKAWVEDGYDFFLTVIAPHKDRVLLALLEKFYAGNPSVISELKHYLESKDIPCEFFNYL
jgi:hypothetical protein